MVFFYVTSVTMEHYSSIGIAKESLVAMSNKSH